MASARAVEVAEVLWELKRANKIATYTNIAKRAGFSAGSNGRTMKTCMKAVRRDWPHLQWWRALLDSGVLDPEQVQMLEDEGGYQVAVKEEDKAEGTVEIEMETLSEEMMDWEEPAEKEAAEAE